VTTVHIEHPVQNFAGWKAVFDQFGEMRTEHHVRRYDISTAVDDPNFVMIRLDFDSHVDAEAFVVTMRGVWAAPLAATVLGGTPSARITETVEAREVQTV